MSHTVVFSKSNWGSCKSINKTGEIGAVLTDFSKALDWFDHDSLIAKLNAQGFEKQSIDVICSYLNKRKQRKKLDSAFG